MAGKLQVFEKCRSHGFEFDDMTSSYDMNKPLCYNQGVKALGDLEVLQLCGLGNPTRLPDKKYCTSCAFFADNAP